MKARDITKSGLMLLPHGPISHSFCRLYMSLRCKVAPGLITGQGPLSDWPGPSVLSFAVIPSSGLQQEHCYFDIRHIGTEKRTCSREDCHRKDGYHQISPQMPATDSSLLKHPDLASIIIHQLLNFFSRAGDLLAVSSLLWSLPVSGWLVFSLGSSQ